MLPGSLNNFTVAATPAPAPAPAVAPATEIATQPATAAAGAAKQPAAKPTKPAAAATAGAATTPSSAAAGAAVPKPKAAAAAGSQAADRAAADQMVEAAAVRPAAAKPVAAVKPVAAAKPAAKVAPTPKPVAATQPTAAVQMPPRMLITQGPEYALALPNPAVPQRAGVPSAVIFPAAVAVGARTGLGPFKAQALPPYPLRANRAVGYGNLVPVVQFANKHYYLYQVSRAGLLSMACQSPALLPAQLCCVCKQVQVPPCFLLAGSACGHVVVCWLLSSHLE